MTSKYEEALKELKNKRCETCNGSGKQDDADLGDISFNTWTCTTCNGSGFNPEKDAKS